MNAVASCWICWNNPRQFALRLRVSKNSVRICPRRSASTWLAVPKFASRLAVASAALLLVASTWLYEKPPSIPNQQATALAAQELLFEAPPPANQDDVLVPAQENNP